MEISAISKKDKKSIKIYLKWFFGVLKEANHDIGQE